LLQGFFDFRVDGAGQGGGARLGGTDFALCAGNFTLVLVVQLQRDRNRYAQRTPANAPGPLVGILAADHKIDAAVGDLQLQVGPGCGLGLDGEQVIGPAGESQFGELGGMEGRGVRTEVPRNLEVRGSLFAADEELELDFRLLQLQLCLLNAGLALQSGQAGALQLHFG
jgi:hypothetical protein